jgi:nitric oxide reductase activation protein
MQYTGRIAWEHTKKQVDKIRREGIKVLSYYVSERNEVSQYSNSYEAFKTMYGNDAKFINITNVVEVSTTMNRLFLSK